MIKKNVIHAYSCYNTVAIQQRMGTASISKEMSPLLYRPSVKIHFAVKFQVISNIFLFIMQQSPQLR
jgi:hypothetical protein